MQVCEMWNVEALSENLMKQNNWHSFRYFSIYVNEIRRKKTQIQKKKTVNQMKLKTNMP